MQTYKNVAYFAAGVTTAGFLGWKLTAGLGAMAAFDLFAMAPYTEMVLKGVALESGRMAV